eukprot:713680-Prorocentrum_lima.AAC.1
MTSSLVGRRMCIRDRANWRHRIAMRGRLVLRAYPSACQRGSGNPPVSYTHLTLPTICSV